MNFPLYIARRIYGSDDQAQKKVSGPAIKIATLGVIIGLAVMIVSVSVVFGFKHTIQNKVIGFGSHIQINNLTTAQGTAAFPVKVDTTMMADIQKTKGVKHVQRYAISQGILKTDNDFLGVQFKGVAEEWDSTFIKDNLVEGRLPHFSSKEPSSEILVSRTIAKKLKLKCGERIHAYFIDKEGPRVRKFTVTGIYETNLTQYDKVLCFTDLYQTVAINGWRKNAETGERMRDLVSGVEITVDDFDSNEAVCRTISKKINGEQDEYGNSYYVSTIQKLNPHIFAWLDLLDMNVLIILILMMIVASVTMISGLLIIILERTTMIGILKALGSRNGEIRKTFLWFGAFIIIKGIVIGDILAIVLLFLQDKIGIIRLDPETYYVDAVPVEFNWLAFLLVNIGTLALSVFILIFPSFLVSHIQPAKAMKFE